MLRPFYGGLFHIQGCIELEQQAFVEQRYSNNSDDYWGVLLGK